jgi:hypothetical protein
LRTKRAAACLRGRFRFFFDIIGPATNFLEFKLLLRQSDAANSNIPQIGGGPDPPAPRHTSAVFAG